MSRQRIALLSGTIALVVAACGEQGADPSPFDEATVVAKSAPVAAAFQKALKGELQAALKAGGPKQAVSVCQQAAPAIAAQQGEASGAEVRRVARKNRNPDGALTPELEAAYAQLEAAPIADGKPAHVVWRSGKGINARTNFLSAIPMQEKPCSVCHGSNVAPELKAHIETLYPGDLATGFKPGDLRGALLVSWAVEGAGG